MSRMRWLVISSILAVLVTGCGKSSTTPQVATDAGTGSENGVKLDGPAAAAYEFLEALRTGNDERAAKMLSAAARDKAASLNRNVTPPASDTARFTVGKVDYVNDDGARVACTWTDIDDAGQPKTDQAIWALRREQQEWRIVGVAAQIFPGEPPLLLNFEDPDDMFRKQQWVREELRRRTETGGLQAQNAEKKEKPLRR
jgi:hypothetical protein